MKDLANYNLGPCKIYNGQKRTLAKKMSVCYAVTIAIHCADCEKKERQLYNSVNYESRMVAKNNLTTKE